jgi:hypothetical protein
MNYPPPRPPIARYYGTSTPPVPATPQQYPEPFPRAASAAPHLGPSPSGLKPPALPHQGFPGRQPSPGPAPPGRQPSPNFIQRSPSPAQSMQRARRHYPAAAPVNNQASAAPPQFFSPAQVPAQQTPNGYSNVSPPSQSPTPTLPYNPNSNQLYGSATQAMSNLSLNGSTPMANGPVNVPLIGQPPLIEDLYAPPPSNDLPPNVSFPYWWILNDVVLSLANHGNSKKL